jgi:farnesyl diphosphate synthase
VRLNHIIFETLYLTDVCIRHQLIVIYKTAYYSFYLPVALGMRYAGIYSDEAYATALSILIPIGEYFQVQDDYLDCFGTPEQIGKVGTDILDNKCSWNVNIALQRANEKQRKILDVSFMVRLPIRSCS